MAGPSEHKAEKHGNKRKYGVSTHRIYFKIGFQGYCGLDYKSLVKFQKFKMVPTWQT